MFVGQVVKTHMFVEHVSRNVRIVCVCVSTLQRAWWVGVAAIVKGRTRKESNLQRRTRLTMSHSCRAFAPNEMMCSV